MPSDSCNSTMAKTTGLIFSLFNVASARKVPFAILPYMQCILHGLTTALLCVPFIFVQHEKCWFCGRYVMASICGYFGYKSLNNCWFVLLHNGLNIADNEVSSFQMKMHKWGMPCDCFDAVYIYIYMGSPAIIRLCCSIIFQPFNHISAATRRGRGLQPPYDRDTLIE